MPPSLSGLKKAFAEHGVVLLSRPSADIRPGAVFDPDGNVVEHLTDLKDKTGGTFFGNPVTLGTPVPASFVLDEVVVKTGGGGSVGLDYLKIASVKAAAKASSEVTIKFGPMKVVRIQSGVDAIGKPSYLEGSDYCTLLTENLKWAPLKVLVGQMRKHTLGLPSLFPRRLDVAQALVYAESVDFRFTRKSGVDFEAAVAPCKVLDVEAGFQTTASRDGVVSWHNGDAMPIGFLPVRYAFRESDDVFVTIPD